MTITVWGIPAAQGSKRFVGMSKSGRGILIESSARVKPWRASVKDAALDALNKPDAPFPMMMGPVEVRIIFTLPKPKSAPKRVRTWPDKKPDVDKLCRCAIDSLTDAGAFEDDARIVRLVATKCYPGEGTDALHIPGCVIHISEVKE